MLVIDNIIDYYEENSGAYNLVFKTNIWGILIWLLFLIVNFAVVGMALYQLWTGDLPSNIYLMGLGGYIVFFLSCLVWTSWRIKNKLWRVFKTTSYDRLQEASYYELFEKSKIRHLKLTEIIVNKYRALKLLEYWRVINYLEEEDFLQSSQIKNLINFIYKRKEKESDLVVLTGRFLLTMVLAVGGIFVLQIMISKANISFDFGRFLLKGGFTFGLVIGVIRSSFRKNKINKLIEILEDIYFRA